MDVDPKESDPRDNETSDVLDVTKHTLNVPDTGQMVINNMKKKQFIL